MNWSHWIRQTHRWLSITFTALVIANFVALGVGLREDLSMGLGFLTLVPLFLLLGTGLYMFVLPYVARRKGSGSASP